MKREFLQKVCCVPCRLQTRIS